MIYNSSFNNLITLDVIFIQLLQMRIKILMKQSFYKHH